jgi:hypothetical protein
MKRYIKQALFPTRKFASQFVHVEDTIIYKAATMIAPEQIEGDYLEFGVFAGGSFINAYTTLKAVFAAHQAVGGGRTKKEAQEIGEVWNRMRYFAFDSFQGLPELTGIDTQTRDFSAGKYSYGEEAFRNNLRRAGVPLEKVITVPGWFDRTCTEETIKKYQMKQAAIIHVDCDLYSSAITVLDFVGPLMADGAIIIFDDWYSYRGNPHMGEQRAFNEWKERLPGWTFTEYQKEGPYRNSFIASRLPTE